MVNFKVPALLFAFATGAMAAAYPRDVAAPINEKSVVARDELAPEHVNELVTRQVDIVAQLTAAINTCSSACAPHVTKIQQSCKTVTVTADLVVILKAEIQALITALTTLLAALKVIAALKVTVAVSLCINILTVLVTILIDVCLALVVRVDIAAIISALGSLWVSVWLNIWLSIYAELVLIITGLGPALIQICTGLGLTVAVCIKLSLQGLIGKYC